MANGRTKIMEFESDEILRIIKENGRNLGNFNGFLNRIDELSHTYDKFRFSGDINKPAFETGDGSLFPFTLFS